MAAKFIELRDVYGNRVEVNIERVTHVVRYTDDQTHIYFGNEQKVMIEGPLSEVMRKLKQ